MAKIDIYSDGSSFIKFKENYYEASSASLIYINDELVYKCGAFHNNGTNSVGEVYAILLGLSKLKDIMQSNPDLYGSQINVYIDSDYVVKSLTSYIKEWSKVGEDKVWYGYKSSKPVAYQDYFKFIYYNFLYKGNPYKIKFYHINSHLQSEASLKKARFKFMNRNSMDISLEDFKKHATRNDETDKYAEYVRINKIWFIEEGMKWVKISGTLTRNQRNVIRKRRNIRN